MNAICVHGMRRLAALLSMVFLVGGLSTDVGHAAYTPPANNRVDFNFNYDWLFIKQDVAGASNTVFSDSSWQPVSLPHTWNNDKFREWIFNSNDKNGDPLNPSGTYYGLAWYRKHFTIDSAYSGRKIILEFQGIGRCANFYVNGVWVGLHENGVAPCGVDITTNVVFGADNVIAVQVNNNENYQTVNYHGVGLPYGQPFNPNFGGLNRDVTLHICDKLYQTLPLYRNLGTVGTYIYATNIITSNQTATLSFQAEVKNDYAGTQTVNCDAVVVDLASNVVMNLSAGQQTIAAGQKFTFTASGSMTNIHFWYPNFPYLYRVYTILSTNGTVVDVIQNPLGVRQVLFSPTAGLLINGYPIYLKGFAPRCSMEWPCVGVPVDWLNDYDFQQMKNCNANFVRPMHIAPRKAMVEAADKFGIVMVCPAANNEGDETDTNKWQERLDIMRDVTIYFRNNPSVMFYEGCNQILTAQHMTDMKNIRLAWDPNGGRFAGLRSNDGNVTQGIREYSCTMDGAEHQLYTPLWDAEYARAEGPRRVWDNYTPMLNPRATNLATKYITGGYFYIASDYHQAFGLNSGVSDFIGDYLHPIPAANGYSSAYFRVQNSEDMVLENLAKYYARYSYSSFIQNSNTSASKGVMVGGAKIIWADSVTDGRMHDMEVTRTSGAVDGARLPKEVYYGLQVAHSTSPQVYVVGHWNYPSNTVKTVYVVGNTPQVGLRTYTPGGTLIKDYGYGATNFFPASILPLGGDQVNAYVFAFTNVAWQPGTITATGYSNGVAVATHSKQTTGPAVALRLTPMVGPSGQFFADGSDIAMFDAEVVDANGNRCLTYEDSVSFNCSGQGVFLGGYNSGKRYSTDLTNLTNGYALNVECGINRVFVRSTRTAGTFTLTVSSTNGLTSATTNVTSTAFAVTNGLTSVLPQKYNVTLGAEPPAIPTPVIVPPPPPPATPAPTTNIVDFGYSGGNQGALVITNAQPGMQVYVDSPVTFGSLPSYLIGANYIQPYLSDAGETAATDQYQFDLVRYSYIYLVIDAANAMPLNDNNDSYKWQKLSDIVMINGRPMNVYKSRLMAPYENGYFADNGYGNTPFDPNSNMYLVFVASAEQQLQSPSQTVTASSYQNGNTPQNGFDGNASTRWSAADGTFPQWITVDLGQPCLIGGYAINWFNATNRSYQYTVQVSNDGTNYNMSLDMRANSRQDASEYRVPSVGATSGRWVMVTVMNAGGWASFNDMVINGVPATVPAAPTGLTATASNGQVALNWTAVTNASSYNVKRATTSGGPYTIISSFGAVTGTNYTDTTAYNGLTYYYVVSSANSNFEGANSTEVIASPTGPPPIPAGLTAVPAVGFVTLTWQPVPGATATYNVKRSTSTGTETIITNVPANGYTDSNVTNETTYYYKVSAVTTYGEGTNSAEVNATPYNQPILQLRLPLGETNTGANYTTASDTNNGVANVTLNIVNAAGSPADLHGTTGSGAGNYGQALDFSSVSAQGNGSATPNASATNSPALGFGTFNKWNASIWFKPSRPLPGPLDGPLLFVLGANGTTTNGQTNSIALKLTGTNQLSVFVNNATPVSFSTATTFATNNWYFAAANFDGTNLKVYFGSDASNATLLGSTAIGAMPVNFGAAGSIAIGNNSSDRARGLAGWLDDFRFYSGTVVASFVAGIQQSNLTVLIPPAPTGATAMPGNNQANLNWNAATWATEYNVKRSTTSGAETTLPAGTNVAGSTFTDSTAVNGTTYYYVISGINTNGEGANSAEVSVTPIPPPAAPTGLTATPSGTQISNLQVALAWNASATATGYNLKRSTSSGTETTVITLAGTSYTDTNVVNGTLYYYVVSASNLSGEGTNSTEASARPIVAPPAPTGLTPTVGLNQLGLSWTAAAGAATYNVKRSTASGAEATIASVAGTTYTDTNAASGTNYYYVVSGVNSVGQGSNSTEVSASSVSWEIAMNCGSATAYGQFASDTNYAGGTASASGTAVTVTNLVIPAPSNVYQSSRFGGFTYAFTNLPSGLYNVRLHFCETYWSATNSRLFNTFINGTQVLTNFDIFASAGGQNVATICQFTTSANSTNAVVIQFVTTKNNAQVNGIEILPVSPPSTPTGVSATPGNGQIVVGWVAAAGATSYNVKRSATSGAETTVTNLASTGYTDLGLTNGTTYYYVVSAVGATGESTNSTEVSTSPTGLPPAPTGLTANAGTGYVTLVWQPAPGTSPTYNVKRSTSAGTEVTITNVPATGYTDSNVVNGTTYYYKVSAVTSYGEGANSGEVYATPTSVAAPPAPTGLTATPGYSQIGLVWTAAAGATGYNIKRSTTAGAEVTIASVTTTNYTDAGVINGTNYFYVVSAVNAGGQGANSTEVSAIPLAPGSGQAFRLRLPLNDAGPGTTTASDTNGGAASVVMTMLNSGGTAADYHGTSGSGPAGGTTRAMDFTSGSFSSSGPVATTNTGALAFGTVTNWTVTYWFKQSQTGSFPSGFPPRFFALGMDSSGTTDGGAANAIEMRLADTTDFYIFPGANKVTVPYTQVANKWQFCALTYDGTNFKMYMGSDISSATLVTNVAVANGAVNFTGTPYLWLGNRADRTRSLASWMSDFRFYTNSGNSAFVESVRQANAPAPSAPTNLVATGSAGQVVLAWTAQPNAISYNVKRSTGTGAEVTLTNVPVAGFTDFNVTGGTTYYYVVTAVGGAGESTASAEAYATPPATLTPYQLWQMQYFGSTTNTLAATNADASGTGQNNLFKYTAGLNPTSPASVFVLQMGRMSNGPMLSFGPITSNRTYSVQYRTDLWTSSWTTLTGALNSMTNGGQMTVTDTNPMPTAKFYRVGITTP